MEEEFEVFDGDSAITFHASAEHFAKYRAVEVFASEGHSFSLFQSTPAHKSDIFNDDRKLFTSVLSSSSSKKPVNVQSQIIVPVSSTTNVPSHCPEKPTRVSPCLSLYTKEADFSNIRRAVERVLGTLKDYDWSYIPSETMWKCKFFQGSSIREVYICCYWDSFSEDHLIEVKRVKGDGCLQSAKSNAEIFELLQAAIMNVENTGISVPVKKGGKLRAALPLPSSLKLLPSKEHFLQGIEPLLKMAGSPNLETRIEAAKMLCDLAEDSDRSLLFLPECQDLCFQVLEMLLQDREEESFDVKQFTVMAFGMLAEFDCFRECFLHLKDFDAIIRLIDNASANKPSCLCIQMRRQAAKGLSLLVKKAVSSSSFSSSKLFLAKQLQCSGFTDEQKWRRHCDGLHDDRLKKFAQEIGQCFN